MKIIKRNPSMFQNLLAKEYYNQTTNEKRVIDMIEIKGQERGEILETTTEGTATKEDMEKFKEALKEKISQEEPQDILLIFKNIKGITVKELLEDMELTSFMISIKKAAIVVDDTFADADRDVIGTLIPGVVFNYYSLNELDAAREWLQEK